MRVYPYTRHTIVWQELDVAPLANEDVSDEARLFATADQDDVERPLIGAEPQPTIRHHTNTE